MKKLLLILGLSLILTACGGNEAPAKEPKKEETETEKVEKKAEVKKEVKEEPKEEPKEEKKEAPVLVEEVPFDITLLEPDSAGNVYAEVTFTNNSNHIVTSYDITVLKKDNNEKSYYNTFDTVRPNETSAKFGSFGPSTGLVDDLEYLTLTYIIKRGDDSKQVVYDFKTKKYQVSDWYEMDTGIEPIVKVEELPYTITLEEPDSAGNVYGKGTFTNNSQHTITNFSIVMLLKDKNEKTYYSNYDTVLPGETSPNFSAFGPNTGLDTDLEPLEIEYTAETKEGKRYSITYNVKTEKYEVLELTN